MAIPGRPDGNGDPNGDLCQGAARVGFDWSAPTAASLMRDPSALDAMLAWLGPVVVRYLAVRLDWLRDPGDAAADLGQDVLLRVWRHLPRCRARSERQFLAWVRKIAHRALLDARRSREPVGGGAPLPEIASGADESAGTDVGSTAPAGPELSVLLARLPPSQRVVVERRLLGSESWSAMASALGTTPGALRRRYARAIVALRRDAGA